MTIAACIGILCLGAAIGGLAVYAFTRNGARPVVLIATDVEGVALAQTVQRALLAVGVDTVQLPRA